MNDHLPLRRNIDPNPAADSTELPPLEDWSGGDRPLFGTESTGPTTDLQPAGGAQLPLAYGRHLLAGHLTRYDFNPGPPPSLRFTATLGEGPWQGAVRVDFGPQQLAPSTQSSTPGYRFHSGALSTGVAQPSTFFPAALNPSGTASIELLLDPVLSASERPDLFRGVFDCLLVANYDATGNLTDAASFSANPARVAADILRRAGLLDLIDWPSWTAWRDYCDQPISQPDRPGLRPRFECHLALTSPTGVAAALTQITNSCCSFWQDTGSTIRFIPPITTNSLELTPPVLTLSPANSTPPRLTICDRRNLPTGFIARFRDLDDPELSDALVEIVNDQLEESTGDRRRLQLSLPPTTRFQATRVCQWRLQLDSILDTDVEIHADLTTLNLLPGDIASLDHELVRPPGTEPPRLLVTRTTELPNPAGRAWRRICGRMLQGGLYRDR